MHPRSRTVRRTLGLELLAMLVVLVPSACGGVEKEAEVRHLPDEAKALQPGEYRTEEFEPSLSFRVGKGWENLVEAPRPYSPECVEGFFSEVRRRALA
jgi:hypothetical protein